MVSKWENKQYRLVRQLASFILPSQRTRCYTVKWSLVRWETMLHFGPPPPLYSPHRVRDKWAAAVCTRDSSACRPIFLFIGTSFVQVIKDPPTPWTAEIKSSSRCRIRFMRGFRKRSWDHRFEHLFRQISILQKTRNDDLCQNMLTI